MPPLSRARAALRADAALLLLAACAGTAAPVPPPAPAEVVIAPPLPATVEPTPPPPPTSVVVATTARPEAAPPDLDVTIAPGSAGAFGGATGNTPQGITGIWAVGNHVFAAGPGMILHSEDRGLHFKHSTGPGDWPSVWAASANDVYVAGDKVVHSTDGGATWTAVGRLPGSAYGIWGSGPDDVYAVGGGDHPFVARSTDHGATWIEIKTPVSSGWLYGVTGTGPRELLVVGKNRAASGGSTPGLPPSSAVFLRSTDSGRHWTSLPTFKPGMTEFEESRGACFTPKGLFAASSYALYFTPNLGRTWKRATDVGTEVLSLACRGNDVLVGGRNRKLLVSRDGGATWIDDPLGALWTAPSLSSVQAIFVSEGGEAFVGFEGLYTGARRGSLFRRSP